MAAKKPKMPDPVVIYTPAPAPVAAPLAIDPNAPTTDGDNGPEQTADEQRLENIMTRRRGRLGTVATSFKGVLDSDSSLAPQRKTLLGE